MLFDKQQLNKLYRYCYALTVHRDDAYDLLHSALEKYLMNPPRASYSESAYLRRIIRNQYIDNTRRTNIVKFESFDTDATKGSHDGSFIKSNETGVLNGQDTPHVISINSIALDEMLINEEMVDWIWSMLDTLEREIVFLWAVEGYTAAEVSTELDMPRGTVLSRIHRLRKKINAQLANLEGLDQYPVKYQKTNENIRNSGNTGLKGHKELKAKKQTSVLRRVVGLGKSTEKLRGESR